MFYITNRYFKICCVGELTFAYKIWGVELSVLCYVTDSYWLQFYNSKFIFPRNVYSEECRNTRPFLSMLVLESVKTLFSELSNVNAFYFLIF